MNSLTYSPAPTVEEDFVNLVNLELNDIKHTFFKIGFRLLEANNYKYYKKLGFKSIVECAETLFGFKKTTTYDLMNVALLFKDEKAPMRIDERYDKFSQSQLVLFSNIKHIRGRFVSLCNPSDSIEKLRRAKKVWDSTLYSSLIQIKSLDALIELSEQDTQKPINKGDNTVIVDSTVADVPAEPETVNIIIEPEESPAGENSGYPENFLTLLEEQTGKRMMWLGVRARFDPDDKGMGIKYVDSSLGEVAVQSYLTILKDYRTELKHYIQDVIEAWIKRFNYTITLCGNKQGAKPFAGNIASLLCDKIAEIVTPPEKSKRVRKK